MANTAPTDEINRRVSVLLRLNQANRQSDVTATNQVTSTQGSL
jgi:hypothetical protein